MNDDALLAFADRHPLVACFAMVLLAATVTAPIWMPALIERRR